MPDYAIPPPRREARAKRRNIELEALVLKSRGKSLEEIAEYQGEADVKKVAARIRRAAAAAYRWAVDEQRLLELMSMDEIESQLRQDLMADQPLLSNARGIVLDQDGNPLKDARYHLDVIDRIMRVKERRAKLMGLDAPSRSEVSHIDKVDAEIKALEEELAKRASQAEAEPSEP